MLAIFKRELKAYFLSPIAYVCIGLFIAVSSFFFWGNLTGGNGDFNSNLSIMNFILILIVPILTMKLLAEDRKNGTEVMLVTSPVKLSSIVIGKYLAAFVVFLCMTVISLIYPIILSGFGSKFTMQLVGGYIGFILLGACFVAFGLFASSLSENQIISAVVGVVGLLLMYLLQSMSTSFGGVLGTVLGWLSIFSRYNDFDGGLLNLSNIVYYFSFTAIFIFITVRIIEKRRWSQG
ncbi:MAG: ABC transporter permease [Bacillota bacterium]|nr:ABC transporter permease [Bacillota bacterium]